MQLGWDNLILFTRHLAASTRLDLPLHETVGTMATEAGSRAFAKLLLEMSDRLAGGDPLSAVLDANADAFPGYYRRIVRAGESGGALPEVLDDLAEHLESVFVLRQRLRRILVYPTFVLAILSFFPFFVIRYIIPPFEELYRGVDAALPPLTRFVLGSSNSPLAALLTLGLFALLALTLVLTGTTWSLGTRWRWLERVRLWLPFFGVAFRHGEAARFCQLLGVLLARRVPLPEALELCASATTSPAVADELRRVGDGVVRGGRLGQEVLRSTVFPPTMLWMIQASEERGVLEDSLRHLAVYYQQRVETTLALAREILEPLLIALVGIALLVFLVAFYLPIFNLINLATGWL